MKVGLIGCGGMGTTHNMSLKALSEEMNLEVTALADCREEFLEKAARVWPQAKKYQTGMELLEAESLDLVHICLPSYLHTDHAVKAMEKGMNVFIEKPVCLTEEECRRLMEAERRSSGKVMVGQVVRSFPEYRYLKEVYEKKTYGRLSSIVMQRISGDTAWGFEDWFHDEAKSGSVVLDLHIHDLDFLRYMLGEPDSFEVCASAFSSGMVSQVLTTYTFGDVFASAEGVWHISPSVPFEASYRAEFEEAVVIFNGNKTPAVTVYLKDGSVLCPELSTEYDVEDHSAGINVSNLGPYYVEIKYFLQCLKENREPELAPLKEGVQSVRCAIEEWKAAKEYISKRCALLGEK